MSQPLFWPSKTPFCPIGDTAPVSLAQDLAPEQPANILLLGCGDPRNILLTLFVDSVVPAARNILLFTLLDDKEHIDRVWDGFYHFKIDNQASTVLTRQSQRLYENAQDIEIWRRSPYGSFVQFVDTRTLAELRRHWKSYADFPNLPPDRLDQLLEQQSNLSAAVLDKKNSYTGASLVTGIFSAQAATPLSNLYKRYWKTGNILDQDINVQTTMNLNPTFVYSSSGETFNLHPDTFPQGFHLTSAMTPTLSDTTSTATPATEAAIVNVMKQQFRKWADAFLASRAEGAITLRFFSGDTLAFCRALDFYAYTGNPSTSVPVSSWRAAQISLEEMRDSVPPAPTTFDVIDTSDLADHLGLFNLLLATRPLLKETPLSQAVLYTETTLCAGKDPIRPFMDRIFSTIPTISILLGVAPRAYVSAFTSHFNIHELLSPQHTDRYHERVAWVDPSSGDLHTNQHNTVSFDAENLAQIVFGVYDKMFAPEQVEPLMIFGAKLKVGIPLRYHRETVVMLWKLVKRRVDLKTGDWDVMMKKFLGLYEGARYVLSAGVYNEDLSAQLHLHSAHTVRTLEQDWRVRFAASHSSGLFRDWPDVPSLLCVVFTIPRQKLQVLLEHDNKKGTPTLECRFAWTNGESHTYSSVHAVWGKCATAEGSDIVTLEENPDGIRGTSDLVVTFKTTESTQEFSGHWTPSILAWRVEKKVY
ncbi:hypothetical protein FRC10_006490 [Ceratobasidium sp. 414]|nr:hypothetical protein FRC10_006490 [Ceratobasidium sp. 414]